MNTIEKEVKKYLKERGWDKLRPGDLAKSIAIESGELLELFQWHNPTLEEVKKDKEKIAVLKKELADVLLYCFDLSVTLGLDTEKIILEKLDHVKKKYPAKLMKNRNGKDPGNPQDIYWKIKSEYRKKGM
jgi:NTP pyrophosphatase (non-canonical NTP hydrolase)